MIKSLRLAVVIALVLSVLSACDSIIGSSKFNVTSEQMARVNQAEIVDRAELKVNMPRYLARQLMSLEKQIRATEYARHLTIESNVCEPAAVVNVFDARTDFQSSVLRSNLIEEDRVIQSILKTASISDPEAISLSGFDQDDDLGFADFENFLRLITDAMNADRSFLNLRGVRAESSAGGAESPHSSPSWRLWTRMPQNPNKPQYLPTLELTIMVNL
jgi:hypothetical protein